MAITSPGLAEQYDEAWRTDGVEYNRGHPLVGMINDILAPGSKARELGVLDLGSGPGAYTVPLAETGLPVDAVDFSPWAINHLKETSKRLGLGIVAVRGDVRAYPKPGVMHGGILASFMLHHLSPDDATQLQARMRAHTTPGGVIAVSAHTSDSDLRRANPTAEEYFPDGVHELLGSYVADGWSTVACLTDEAELPPSYQGTSNVVHFVVQRPD